MRNLYLVGAIRDKQREIIEKMVRVESALEKVTSRMDIIPGGGYTDRFTFLIGMKIDLENELDCISKEYVDAQFELSKWFDEVCRNEIVARVMERRYGMLESFRDIAKYLRISERQVYRLHKLGLERLDNVRNNFKDSNAET